MTATFKQFTNKPKTIEAIQFTDEDKNRVLNSLTGQHAPDFENGQPVIKVTTVHGETAIVRLGDWIVKEAEAGFYYPVKDSVFRKSYNVDVEGEVG